MNNESNFQVSSVLKKTRCRRCLCNRVFPGNVASRDLKCQVCDEWNYPVNCALFSNFASSTSQNGFVAGTSVIRSDLKGTWTVGNRVDGNELWWKGVRRKLRSISLIRFRLGLTHSRQWRPNKSESHSTRSSHETNRRWDVRSRIIWFGFIYILWGIRRLLLEETSERKTSQYSHEIFNRVLGKPQSRSQCFHRPSWTFVSCKEAPNFVTKIRRRVPKMILISQNIFRSSQIPSTSSVLS